MDPIAGTAAPPGEQVCNPRTRRRRLSRNLGRDRRRARRYRPRLFPATTGGAMVIRKLAHAGVIVQTRRIACLMDPVLTDPFENGVNTFDPPVELLPDAVAGCYNALVISHEHMDHFCVRTLARLDRTRPVFFPARCGLLRLALERLGFSNLHGVSAGETVELEDLTVTFTPSATSIPELGAIFASQTHSLWNAVDTVVDESAISLIRARRSRVDLMLASYQPMIEGPLAFDGLGAPFPFDHYGANLRTVIEVAPHCVVPSACGYRYSLETWKNHRGFPIHEDDFIRDLAIAAPGIRAMKLAPGAAIDLADDFRVHTDSLPFLKARRAEAPNGTTWRPDLGIPALVDDRLDDLAVDRRRRQVAALLSGDLLSRLMEDGLAGWRQRMARGEVVWQLEVVYADGQREAHYLDLRADPPQWLDHAPPLSPKMVTSIGASTLIGLADGRVNSYRAGHCKRSVLRLYYPTKWGVERFGGPGDEPLARTLLPLADRRFVERELEALGY
jgi:UDP-MurNAc hydroxylase